MSERHPVLEVSGLTVAFGAFRAVDDLSFTVGTGEMLAIAGESGSGKSMTALAVMGLAPKEARVTAVSMRLAGREIAGLPEKRMRGLRGSEIGLIFQEPMTALNPVMTVGDQIMSSPRPTGSWPSVKPPEGQRVPISREECVPHPPLPSPLSPSSPFAAMM